MRPRVIGLAIVGLAAIASAPRPAHSAAAAAPLPPALGGQQLSILVGDPDLGRKYFNGSIGKCSTCHAVADGQPSKAANLAHIATKYPDPKAMQNAMVLNRASAWSPRNGKDVSVTVTYKTGKTMKGYLSSISDFKLVIRDENDKPTTIPLNGPEPRVVLVDRLQAHLDLMEVYQDTDIHNLTAYLATLK